MSGRVSGRVSGRMGIGRALIVGAGPGLSASVARLLAGEGAQVVLAARNVGKLAGLAGEIAADVHPCDATDAGSVDALFAAAGACDLVMFNASARARGPVAELDRDAVRRSLEVTAYAGFLVAQAAARAMLPEPTRPGRGVIVLTGASASVKGYPQSAPFAMGKFALRGLAQSMARELHPRGVHVVHVVVDGGIRSDGRPDPGDSPDSLLDPDAIAQTIVDLARQPRSCWTDEVAVRPWVERF